MASRLQDVILRGLAADKPLATNVAPGTLYYNSDTFVTERSSGTIWESYTDSAGSTPTAHAITHNEGGTDEIDITTLGGYTGGTTNFLRADATFAAPPSGSSAAHATTHEVGGADVIDGDLHLTSLSVGTSPALTGAVRLANNTAIIARSFSDVVDLSLIGTNTGNDTLLGNASTIIICQNSLRIGSNYVELTERSPVPVPATNSASLFLRDSSGSSQLAVQFATGVAVGIATEGTSSTRIGSISMIIDGGSSAITTGIKGYLEIPFTCTIQAVTLLADQVGSIVVDIWKDTYANYPPTVVDSITSTTKPTISATNKSQDMILTGWNTAISSGDILGFNVDSVTTVTKITLSLKIQVT